MRDFARGYTLTELIVVMGIAAVLLGMGIGGYLGMNRTLAFNGATQLVEGQLMAARNTAVYAHASTFVILDCKENLISTYGRTAGGLWHFDDKLAGETVDTTVGAFGHKGMVKDGQGSPSSTVLVEGHYGAALPFPGPGVADTERRYVECGESPAFIPEYHNVVEGIAIEAWVCPEKASGGTPLANGALLPVVTKVGSSDSAYAPYGLFLEYEQPAEKFRARALVTVLNGAQPEVREVNTTDAFVRPEVWSHLAMSYTQGDGTLRLSVNGILRADDSAQKRAKQPILVNIQPVRIGQAQNVTRSAGGGTSGDFCGRIDEVTIGVYARSSPEQVSPKVTLAVINPATPETQTNLGQYTIYFDPRGYLDRKYHSSIPEVIVFSPAVKWESDPAAMYDSLQSLSDFRNQFLKDEWDRKSLNDQNRIHRLKLTWSGTVE